MFEFFCHKNSEICGGLEIHPHVGIFLQRTQFISMWKSKHLEINLENSTSNFFLINAITEKLPHFSFKSLDTSSFTVRRALFSELFRLHGDLKHSSFCPTLQFVIYFQSNFKKFSHHPLRSLFAIRSAMYVVILFWVFEVLCILIRFEV